MVHMISSAGEANIFAGEKTCPNGSGGKLGGDGVRAAAGIGGGSVAVSMPLSSNSCANEGDNGDAIAGSPENQEKILCVAQCNAHKLYKLRCMHQLQVVKTLPKQSREM